MRFPDYGDFDKYEPSIEVCFCNGFGMFVPFPDIHYSLFQYLRKDFPIEQEKISLWGFVTELGLCIGCCFFLVPLVWGVYLVILAIVLFILSLLGVRLTKKKGGDKV